MGMIAQGATDHTRYEPPTSNSRSSDEDPLEWLYSDDQDESNILLLTVHSYSAPPILDRVPQPSNPQWRETGSGYQREDTPSTPCRVQHPATPAQDLIPEYNTPEIAPSPAKTFPVREPTTTQTPVGNAGSASVRRTALAKQTLATASQDSVDRSGLVPDTAVNAPREVSGKTQQDSTEVDQSSLGAAQELTDGNTTRRSQDYQSTVQEPAPAVSESEETTSPPPASASAILPVNAQEEPISGLMSATEVMTRLQDHGCKNITPLLNTLLCGENPVSRGGFGDVYRGRLLDGSQIAIKTMRIYVDSREVQKPFKDAARELHTWSKCLHPNVVELLGIVEFRGQIGMVSYWMKNGNLPAYLERLPNVDRCLLSAEICEGLTFLHAANIVHGDLKGLNVLISDDGRPMLTDFGNAILGASTLKFTTTTEKNSHSPRWTAPELLMGTGTRGFEADVYALGMTILETITGKLPYVDKGDYAIILAVAVNKEPPPVPKDFIPPNSKDGSILWALLTDCWMYEPERRPSAKCVLDVMKTVTQSGLVAGPPVKIGE